MITEMVMGYSGMCKQWVETMADILACLLDLNFKKSNLSRLNFLTSKLTLIKIDAYFP
jgi:hypothetical protein